MKEPGDMSGVARVTFPNDTGTYRVSYIRHGSTSLIVLGELIISIPTRSTRESLGHTYDTESYSPRFLNSIKKRASIGGFLQESTKTGECESECTAKGNPF